MRVDADMDELPTDAVVTIHCAGYRPVPNRTDAAELFNIEVNELARIFAFIAPDGFSSSKALSLFNPSRRKTRLTFWIENAQRYAAP